MAEPPAPAMSSAVTIGLASRTMPSTATAPVKDCAPICLVRLPTCSASTAPNGMETSAVGRMVTLAMNQACWTNSSPWNGPLEQAAQDVERRTRRSRRRPATGARGASAISAPAVAPLHAGRGLARTAIGGARLASRTAGPDGRRGAAGAGAAPRRAHGLVLAGRRGVEVARSSTTAAPGRGRAAVAACAGGRRRWGSSARPCAERRSGSSRSGRRRSRAAGRRRARAATRRAGAASRGSRPSLVGSCTGMGGSAPSSLPPRLGRELAGVLLLGHADRALALAVEELAHDRLVAELSSISRGPNIARWRR